MNSKNNARLKRRRKKVSNRQNCLCFYCNKYMKPNDRTLDHIIPEVFYKRIGAYVKTQGNIVMSHHKCNLKKGDSVPDIADVDRAIKTHNYDPVPLLKQYFVFKHKFKPLMDSGVI